MKTTHTLAVLLLASCTAVQAQDIRPLGAVEGEIRWKELGNRTDDFEGNSLNTAKWINAPSDLVIGAWTFDENNAYVRDGKLNIIATQETHTRPFRDSCQGGATVQRELYYKSGAVKSAADGVYGYYEARIKGVKIFPGLSPAFWLYSDGHPYPDRNVPGSVDYSEIDVVELQQADWYGPGPDDADPVNVMDHNLHARIVGEDGKTYWRRPKPYPEAQLLKFEAPFDPSKDFHTYAVENRKDVIRWYVDGELIGEKPNLFWHRPMHVIFSMGLRRQLIKYNDACNRADPNPDTVTAEGFPEDATMQVEYVKTWEVLPSIWVDNKNKYLTTDYETGGELEVVVNYHGGSNHHVVGDKYNGITVNLVEKNTEGFVRIVASANDASVISEEKRYGGQTTLRLDLSGVTPADQLPQGHYYALAPVFRSSNGSDIFQMGGLQPIKVVDRQSPGPVAVTGVSVSADTTELQVGETTRLEATVFPANADNPDVSWHSNNMQVATVDQQGQVQGKSVGNVKITVTTEDGGHKASTKLSVVSSSGDGESCTGGWVPVSGVHVTPDSGELSVGQSIRITPTVTPACASNKRVVFSSSNPSVAIVNADGVVSAKRAGSAEITVKTKNKEKTATYSLTVTP
ncbi:Ig-like domain-containing protein [Microbulbifer thermotolerans]|uniref:Ig-like domain-containing protein n=1 Tax=Microbulbifer thermotolerans TaxID=252514 RepID=UPI002672200F|nr:Ig-like domain-containing protein [Microbulbifer thermotolerans]WKT59398.1 Ig-like domain-containing protein [Microbulbifer thermotolerans]